MMTIQTAIRNYLLKRDIQHISLQAVLFDMDGVLYDSMKNHTLAWYETMSQRGLACERNEFYLHEGRTGASTIDLIFKRCLNRIATEEEKAAIYKEKSTRFDVLPKPLPIPGVAHLLRQVKEAGLIPVLVTGSGQRGLLDKLNYDFPGVFEPPYMVTAYDVKYGKPHPEPYLMGLEKAGVAPEEAFVVENAPMGVQSASAAGIFTIAVNTGPIEPVVLGESGADFQYPDMLSLDRDFPNLYSEMNRIEK